MAGLKRCLPAAALLPRAARRPDAEIAWGFYRGWVEEAPLYGIFATALVNLVRRFVYPNQPTQLTDAGERRAQKEITS